MINPLTVSRIVEIYATSPNIEHQAVAKEVGISEKSLRKLRRSPDFNRRIYDSFMISYEGELLDVIRAMVKEAKAGNIQAGRLVLEHGNKLQKNINVNVTSPFDRWLVFEESKNALNSMDGEIIVDELPEKTDEPSERDLKKRAEWNNRRKELRSWTVRAKKVGIEPLPPKRPKKSERLEWEQSIIQAEED